ncbi:MAG TPA: 50S ribosomal protein L24 [Candidatus Omnitrophota bacterium]|nr:50S ribosomal protein L24 [Candidatus Omnitrophota bacterium]
MLRIKKNDIVAVITGRDKGKTGKVLRVFPAQQKVLVEKINMAKKARRKTQQDQTGGLVDIEVPIHISNVMLMDKKTNKPTRFGVKILKDGSHVRVSKRSGEEL